MKIRNKNFICDKMIKRDVLEAFVNEHNTFIDLTCDLIGNGYITKQGDRYFVPTKKLMEEIFLPKNGRYTLDEHQIRFLSNQSSFYFNELLFSLDENATLVNAMIRIGLLKFHTDKRYRKSSEFEEFLADGGDIIKVKDVEGVEE